MTYVIWDKISPIYDVTAEQAIQNNPLYGTENSYVFYKENGTIYNILPISSLRRFTGLDNSMSDTEICDAYIAMLTAPTTTNEDEIISLKNQIAELIESNQILEDCLIGMIIKNDLTVPNIIQN